MQHIAIVGAGLIGRAWALVYARGGYAVNLWDQDAAQVSQALEFAHAVLPDLAQHGLLRGQTPAEVHARLRPTSRLEDCVHDAVLVQENAPENLDIKRQVWAQLDTLTAPETILASSTSALQPSQFTDHLQHRTRCLVAHPINPPYLVPAVELVPAPWTAAETLERTRQIMVEVGQQPMVMQREIDGFIMNRMQGALMQEAVRLVADGYASVEDVDIGIREGLALRWSFMGPFETIDLNAPAGVRDYVERYSPIYQRLFPSQCQPVEWGGETLDRIEQQRRARLPQEDLAARQLWRDRRLMALAAHKQSLDQD